MLDGISRRSAAEKLCQTHKNHLSRSLRTLAITILSLSPRVPWWITRSLAALTVGCLSGQGPALPHLRLGRASQNKCIGNTKLPIGSDNPTPALDHAGYFL